MKKSHCLKQTIRVRERETVKKKREVVECQTNLFAYNHVQYIDVFILNLEHIKMEIILERKREGEKHTNHIDEHCTIYQLVRYLKRLV
jgi:hypothetical protein